MWHRHDAHESVNAAVLHRLVVVRSAGVDHDLVLGDLVAECPAARVVGYLGHERSQVAERHLVMHVRIVDPHLLALDGRHSYLVAVHADLEERLAMPRVLQLLYVAAGLGPHELRDGV